MIKKFYQSHQTFFKRFDGLLLDNTILSRGLVLSPAIVPAYNAKNALVLGLAFAIITFFTVLFASFISKRLPFTIRVILYAVTACIIFVPTAKMLNAVFPDFIFSLGVFLPLTVVNSLIVIKSESRFNRDSILEVYVDLFCHVAGFFLAILLIGCLREYLCVGKLFGKSIALTLSWKIPAAAYPFGGFILVAFLSAIVQKIRLSLGHQFEK